MTEQASPQRAAGIHGDSAFLRQVATALLNAEQSGATIPPISGDVPYPNIGLACAMQDMGVRLRLANGRSRLAGGVIHHAAEADHRAAGAREPVFGYLFAEMVTGPADIPDVRDREERAAAFAFRLARAPGSPADAAALRPCVQAVLPVQLRYRPRFSQAGATLFDAVADNLGLAGLLTGEPCAVSDWQRPAGLDFDPFAVAAWLARKRSFLGRPLAAGDLIVFGGHEPHDRHGPLPARNG